MALLVQPRLTFSQATGFSGQSSSLCSCERSRKLTTPLRSTNTNTPQSSRAKERRRDRRDTSVEDTSPGNGFRGLLPPEQCRTRIGRTVDHTVLLVQIRQLDLLQRHDARPFHATSRALPRAFDALQASRAKHVRLTSRGHRRLAMRYYSLMADGAAEPSWILVMVSMPNRPLRA